MPTPPPIRRHCFLASAVAANRRGDQDKGTDISRPSASKTRRRYQCNSHPPPTVLLQWPKCSCHLSSSKTTFSSTNRRISLNSLRRNPRHLAKARGDHTSTKRMCAPLSLPKHNAMRSLISLRRPCAQYGTSVSQDASLGTRTSQSAG